MSTPWQDRLSAECLNRNYGPPSYQEFSDRRGGRTAWSCQVLVNGKQYAARNWYDGQFISGAKEDAAEVALMHLDPEAPPPTQQANGGSGQDHGPSPWNQKS